LQEGGGVDVKGGGGKYEPGRYELAIKETPAEIFFFLIFHFSSCDDPRFGCKRLSVFFRNVSIHINVFI
jgi:hypothetical protein